MKSLITGIGGQDGSYLAEILLERGHEVHGVVRRHSQPNHANIQHLLEKDALLLHEGDLADQSSLETIMQAVKPDWIFNLAAQSHVATSFTQPEHTLDVTGLGAWRVLEAARRHAPRARIYQASSSEMYGNAMEASPAPRLNEASPMTPVSPYGTAKLMAHHLARMYRHAHGLFVASGILFNHESPRRGPLFVTRKVTLGLARIRAGLQTTLQLGNLDAERDWGWAPEYCEGMVRMLEVDAPGDYVLATGERHSVRDWVDAALQHTGGGVSWDQIQVTETHKRPHDIQRLVGDARHAREALGWEARVGMYGVVAQMCVSDQRLANQEATRKDTT